MTADGALLVINSGAQTYREYCLALAAAVQPVVLISPDEPTWQKPYIVDHEVADAQDLKALRSATAALAGRHRIIGVLTWDEYSLVPAAHIAADLALPGNSSATANACRNKAASRAVFAAEGVPSAESVRVASLAKAGQAAQRIGYPVVLKPAAHAASIGVIKVNGPEDLPDAYGFATRGAAEQGREGTGVLVEEYLDGAEISVECVTVRGITTPVAVTRKSVGFPPYFEETGHSVEAGDPILAEAGPIAVAALDALGIANGISHVEMRLTDTGPRLVEVNARLGGDLIPHLVREATGIDLPRAAADIACGREPDLSPTRHGAAAISILYPPTTGRLARRAAHAKLVHPSGWLERLVWERQVGDTVTLPPAGNLGTARIGHLVAAGTTTDECRQRLEQATALLDIVVEAGPEA